MGHWIELKPEGAGPIRAWQAEPEGRPRAAVVVIQEIFGVNAHIRSLTDRIAVDGYLAVAPCVFEHVEKDFDVGYDPESRARGMAVVAQVDREQTMRDVAAAIRVAQEGGKVGIVGFCFGGTIAWAAACTQPGLSAAVCYYGGGILGLRDLKPRVPTMLHFGEKDEHIPVAGVREFAARHSDLPVHLYLAGHGFSCDQRQSYDAPSAALAWTRTLEFFRKHLS